MSLDPSVATPFVVRQLLPEGFALPPMPYLLALLLGVGAVAAGVWVRNPPFTEQHVLATVPWMVVGAAAHVLYVLDAVPAVVAPLFGTPAVYVTAAVGGGATWLAATAVGLSAPRTLGAVGTAVAATVIVVLATTVTDARPVLPAAGLLGGTGVGWLTARVVARRVDSVAVAGRAATLAVVAHGVDGVTTAVGVDLLGFGERTPLSAVILEFAAQLPTAATVGSGWLFVLVKLTVAGVAVVAIAPTVAETDREGYALLAVVAAVGLGPGVHNALLFAVAG